MSLVILAAAALGFADPATIDRAVAGFVGPEVENAALPVDRRLRLRACAMPLALSWRLPRRDAVLVRCPDPGSWRLTVPIPVAASAVADAAPAIARGDAVTVLVAGDGFSVSRSGEALEPGAAGSWIKARVLAGSGQPADPLRAQVVRPGLVTIPLP